MSSRPPIVVPKPASSAGRPPEAKAPAWTAAAAPPATRLSGELTPPPADGYYDLVFDDPEPSHSRRTPAGAAEAPVDLAFEPAKADPPEPAEEARILATAGKPAARRRFGTGALVAVAAGVALFGAVGAMALRRPQREEERVSRALLPRAEWATSVSNGASPSPEVLAQLEADEDGPAPAAEATPSGSHGRTRHRPASQPVAPAAVASRALAPERADAAPAPPTAPAAPVPAAAAVAEAPAGTAASRQAEDAPQFVRHGFRAPATENPNCVQSSVRLPRDLQGFVAGPITVRFAVDKDGSVGLFRVEGQVPDQRVAEAIWSAVRECRFVPGEDDQGRPVRLWAVMPIRFVR